MHGLPGKSDPKWEGVLKGGVYHIHKSLGVDESVMWGEYFFAEALEEALRILRTSSQAPTARYLNGRSSS